jgi:hypothetical protein
MYEVPITITNVLPSGSAFGSTLTEPREAVFIPSQVARSVQVTPGMAVLAVLVPNVLHRERTPWLANTLRRDSKAAPMSADVFIARLAEAIRETDTSCAHAADAVVAWADGDYMGAVKALRAQERSRES